MLSVLRVEWLKLKSYKPFWVINLLYPLTFVGMMLIVLRVYTLFQSQKALTDMAFASPPFEFPGIWQSVTYTAGFFHFIPCLLILLNVTNEFQFRTHRQNLMDGWSRLEFLGAKALVALGASCITLVWVALVGLIVGANQGGTLSMAGTHYLGYFFVQSLLYSSLALWLGFFLRRGLLSLAAFLFYSNLLEKILAAVVSSQVDHVAYFAPLASVNQLIPVPMLPQVASKLNEGMPSAHTLMLAGAGWIVFFLGTCWLRFRKEDL